MLVQDLIARLQNLDPDAEVVLRTDMYQTSSYFPALEVWQGRYVREDDYAFDPSYERDFDPEDRYAPDAGVLAVAIEALGEAD